MEYILEDSTGYWLERNLPTLELAEMHAKADTRVVRIVEYTDAHTKPRGVVPTGRMWDIQQSTPKDTP